MPATSGASLAIALASQDISSARCANSAPFLLSLHQNPIVIPWVCRSSAASEGHFYLYQAVSYREGNATRLKLLPRQIYPISTSQMGVNSRQFQISSNEIAAVA